MPRYAIFDRYFLSFEQADNPDSYKSIDIVEAPTVRDALELCAIRDMTPETFDVDLYADEDDLIVINLDLLEQSATEIMKVTG